jgi:hypothetical protein
MAVRVADRLRSDLPRPPVVLANQSGSSRFSAGIAAAGRRRAATAADLVGNADTAHRAKAPAATAVHLLDERQSTIAPMQRLRWHGGIHHIADGHAFFAVAMRQLPLSLSLSLFFACGECLLEPEGRRRPNPGNDAI